MTGQRQHAVLVGVVSQCHHGVGTHGEAETELTESSVRTTIVPQLSDFLYLRAVGFVERKGNGIHIVVVSHVLSRSGSRTGELLMRNGEPIHMHSHRRNAFSIGILKLFITLVAPSNQHAHQGHENKTNFFHSFNELNVN